MNALEVQMVRKLLRTMLLISAVIPWLEVPIANGALFQEPEKNACTVAQLATTYPSDDRIIRIEHNGIEFNEVGQAAADFTIRNLSPQPIDAIAVVMEYLDRAGNTLTRVAGEGATKQALAGFNPPFPIQASSNIWETPIASGNTGGITANQDGVRISACPTSARIAYVMVKYADQTIKTFSSPDWQFGPVPRRVPTVDGNFPQFGINPPAALLATVKIDASGRVLNVVADDQGKEHLVQWFRSWMQKKWTFYPAISGGHSVASELTVLLRVHQRASPEFRDPDNLPSVVTLIQIFPKDDGSDGWRVFYGGLIEYSTIGKMGLGIPAAPL